MARGARIVVPGCPHHVVHRANRGEAIFLAPQQCRLYLRWLASYASAHALSIWAYCVMPNHVHLVAVPAREESLSRAIGQAHMRYSRWVSQERGASGHAWGGRFFSAPLDQAHAWEAVRYVEMNPVRAGLARRASDYAWSSAPAHAQFVEDPLLSRDLPVGAPRHGREWTEWLEMRPGPEVFTDLRLATSTGRPLGSGEFAAGLARVRSESRRRG